MRRLTWASCNLRAFIRFVTICTRSVCHGVVERRTLFNVTAFDYRWTPCVINAPHCVLPRKAEADLLHADRSSTASASGDHGLGTPAYRGRPRQSHLWFSRMRALRLKAIANYLSPQPIETPLTNPVVALPTRWPADSCSGAPCIGANIVSGAGRILE